MIPVRYNLRSLLVRRTTSLMTALGVALVVMILFILLGFTSGLRRTLLQSDNGDAWIVLSRGVSSEPGSYITREQYDILRSRPEIAADASGLPLISPEGVTGFDANLAPLRQIAVSPSCAESIRSPTRSIARCAS